MNETPEIIAERERLKTLTDEELTAEIKKAYQAGACLIGIHIEARMRVHEAEFHGRENRESAQQLLTDSGKRLVEFFESIAPRT